MDEVVWLKTILYIKLDKLWNKAASKRIKIIIMIMGLFKRAASVSSRVLHDSTPRYVGPLVGRSVGRLVSWSRFYFFGVFLVF